MTKFTVPFEGGCRCGAIRYRCRSEPLLSYHCYCTDCQKDSASAFASRIAVFDSDFELIQGTPKLYGTGPDGGTRVRRHFCGKCDADVHSINTQVDFMFVSIGGLVDPSPFEPEVGFWVSSAQPWVQVNRKIKNYETQPTMDKLAEG